MKTEIDCVEFCRALADPTRQHILQMLLDGEKNVSAIVSDCRITQPTVSHHLDVLARYGLVESRKQGKQVFYRAARENITTCCGMLMAKFDNEDEIPTHQGAKK